MDILKKKLKKGKPVTVETWICDNCEKHFITMRTIPHPTYCPFCGAYDVDLNDEIMIRSAFDEKAIKKAGKEFLKKCAKAPYPI